MKHNNCDGYSLRFSCGQNRAPAAPRCKCGFTMVELLVAIAIVGMLAVLVTGAQSSIVARAKQAKCASNLSSLSKATLLFAADHGGRLPSGWNTWYPTVWQVDIAPYLGIETYTTRSKVGSVFQCPTITTADLTGAGVGGVSLGMNEFIIPNTATQTDTAPKYTHAVPNPGSVPFIGDIWLMNTDRLVALSKSNVGTAAFRHPNTPAARPAKSVTASGITAFGTGKANVVFLDGHAESLSPDQLAASGNNTITWNPWK